MIRIFHIADLHIDPTTLSRVESPLSFLTKEIEEKKPDLIVVAGDIFISRDRIDPTALYTAKGYFRSWGGRAPVAIVPGNHDATNNLAAVDSVTAAFTGLESTFPIYTLSRPTIYLVELPGGQFVRVAAMPTPSKYFYLSQVGNLTENIIDRELVDELSLSDMPTEEAISRLADLTLAGLASRVGDDLPSIIVYHGTIRGGVTDSEKILPTGIDISIDGRLVGKSFNACLAGHLHKPQEVGRWVYSGGIAPITFSQEGLEPSYTLWTIREKGERTPVDPDDPSPPRICSVNAWRDAQGRTTDFERIPLPVAEQLLTIEISEADYGSELPDKGPSEALAQKIEDLEEKIAGARIRIKGRLPRSDYDRFDEALIRSLLEGFGAVETRVAVDKIPELKTGAEKVSVEAGIADLLLEWVDINPDLKPIADALFSYAAELEKGIPVETLLNPNGTDYRPLRVSWENYTSYPEGEIRFPELGSLVCISGPNGAGKSNAAEAEAFALFKYLREDSKLGDIVLEGARKTKVELDFEARGSTWRVTRFVSLSKTGKASGDILLEEAVSPGDWENRNGADAGATQAKIEDLVGSLDLYLSTRFGGQFEIDRILSLRPAQRKDLLQRVLNAGIFELRSELASKDGRGLELEIGEAEAEDRRSRAVAEDGPGFRKELETVETQIRGEKKAVEGAETRLKETVDKRDRARRVVGEHNRKQDKTNDFDKRIRGDRDRVEVERRGRADLESAVSDSPRIQKNAARIRELEELVRKDGLSKTEHNTLVRESLDFKTELASKIREAAADRDSIDKTLERKKKAAETAKTVPCKGETWLTPGINPELVEKDDPYYIDMGSCRFLTDAKKALDEIPILEKALEAADKKIEDGPGGKLPKRIDEKAAEIDRLGYDIKRGLKLAEELQKLRGEGWIKKELDLTESRARIDERTAKIEELEREIEKLEADRKAVEYSEPSHLAAVTDEADLGGDESRARSIVSQSKDSLHSCEIRKGELEGSLKVIKKAERDLEQIKKRKEDLELRYRVCKAYGRAVSRDGLPFLVLERAIPELEEITNYFLSDGPISVEIDPIRSESGKQKDELVMRFRDDRGLRPLGRASGAQRIALGAALRGAINRIRSTVNGIRVYHIYIDEGFGAYDEKNLQWVKGLLLKLAGDFERVIYITHIKPIQEIADTELRVVPIAGGSRLELIR